MSDSNETIDRRKFLGKSAVLIAGGAALPGTALSYGRILGANDRISLAHIGTGSRGSDLAWIAAQLKTSQNAEITVVCDLWKLNREKAAATNAKYYGRAPRTFQYLEEVLALKDVDGVIISTPEHAHSPILKMAVEAGKDAYVEKPMGNVLAEVKAARDTVVKSDRIVQVGTQHRSEPYQIAAHDLVQTGVLGDVSKIEIVWNYHGPRWRGREETKLIREEDTDWRKWLLTKPYRPFDPKVYCEFRLYKEFSGGIPDQWMSHAIDLVHWFMKDSFPALGDGAWRNFCVARRPGECGHVSGVVRIPEGISSELRDEFWKRRAVFDALHGKEGDAYEYWGRGKPAVSISRREGQSRGRCGHREEASCEIHSATRRNETSAAGHR